MPYISHEEGALKPPPVAVNFRLPIELWRQAKELGRERNLSLNATLIALCELGLLKLQEETGK